MAKGIHLASPTWLFAINISVKINPTPSSAGPDYDEHWAWRCPTTGTYGGHL